MFHAALRDRQNACPRSCRVYGDEGSSFQELAVLPKRGKDKISDIAR